MPQKKWATPEQEEFLLGHFPEFRKHAVVKRYRDFLKRVGIEWFQRWPERQALFPEFPADHVYTAEEEQKLAAGIETRHQASQGYVNRTKQTCTHRILNSKLPPGSDGRIILSA